MQSDAWLIPTFIGIVYGLLVAAFFTYAAFSFKRHPGYEAI